MNENDEFIGRVEDYLVEFDGDTPLPGRVLDAIHAELPRTRQAKAGPGFMRMPPMLSTVSFRARWEIAVAALIVALAIGTFISRENDLSGVGGVPAASPTPQSSQSAATLLENAPAAPCPGITDELNCIEPGTYQLGSTDLWPAIVTLVVPKNWWLYEGGTSNVGLLVETKDNQGGSGWGVTFSTVGSVMIDPCDRAAGMFETDVHTPGEMYDMIAEWPGFEASEPEPISNGYDGVRFTLTSTKTAAECPGGLMWTTTRSGSVGAYPMVNTQGRPHHTEFRIFDVDGEPLVVMAMNFPETSPFEEENGVPFDPERHAEDLVGMDAILDSIEFKDPQGGAN